MSVLYEKVFPVCYIPLKILVKICLTATIVALLLLPCVFFLDVSTPLMLRKNKVNVSFEERKLKTVLYWTKMFGNKSFYFGEGDVFRDCSISACRATHDRKSQRVQDFDAVLFHGIQTNASDLPTVRSHSQKYIFVLMEPPANWGLDAAYIPDRFYNWTMTYRRDSDIPRPYGYVIHSATNAPLHPFGAGSMYTLADDTVVYGNFRSTKNHTYGLEGKRVAAAWFVSHCRTASSRERYAFELQRYIEVDVFGKCGRRQCPKNSVECYDMLEARYYFYLAFENSLCQDYVTEKLYKVMKYNVVPVVYGAANYTEFAPPGSYINVADFESAAHLAKHLRYLMNNPQEYVKYFWWKEHFIIDLSHRVTLCNMCAMLHDEKSLSVSIRSGLKNWWSRRRCITVPEAHGSEVLESGERRCLEFSEQISAYRRHIMFNTVIVLLSSGPFHLAASKVDQRFAYRSSIVNYRKPIWPVITDWYGYRCYTIPPHSPPCSTSANTHHQALYLRVFTLIALPRYNVLVMPIPLWNMEKFVLRFERIKQVGIVNQEPHSIVAGDDSLEFREPLFDREKRRPNDWPET